METEMQNKIDYYVELYDEIQARSGNDEIAVVIFQEITKDKRRPNYSKPNDQSPATEKQRNCLKKLGKEFPESITKSDANVMIQKALKK